MIEHMIRLWRRHNLWHRRFWCRRIGHLGRAYQHCIYCFEKVGNKVPPYPSELRSMQEEVEQLKQEIHRREQEEQKNKDRIPPQGSSFDEWDEWCEQDKGGS